MGKYPYCAVFSAIFLLSAPAVSLKAAVPVAVVGGGEVSEQDISDWQAAQSCYGADAITSRKAGFMRMFETAILEEVLARRERPITDEQYIEEAARIDAETRAPEILGCIKKYFADGAGRYERVFVRPILAQRFIRELVKYDPEIQARAYSLRDGTLRDIEEKKTFGTIALERGIVYSTAVYSVEEDTTAPAALEPWKRWSQFEADFIEEYLKALKPGEVEAMPIEDEMNIKFVGLISVADNRYFFETLTVPKLSTEDYFGSVRKLPCRINDKELRDWVATIKGNPLLAPAGPEPAGKNTKK